VSFFPQAERLKQAKAAAMMMADVFMVLVWFGWLFVFWV
jgi:hypothetical protein